MTMLGGILGVNVPAYLHLNPTHLSTYKFLLINTDPLVHSHEIPTILSHHHVPQIVHAPLPHFRNLYGEPVFLTPMREGVIMGSPVQGCPCTVMIASVLAVGLTDRPGLRGSGDRGRTGGDGHVV